MTFLAWLESVVKINWQEQALLLISILLSAILGFAIGYERKIRNKEAGIRTHTIVCIGAAIMTVVSMWGFGPYADGARVAAQIVTGVGFLGAGIIVYRQHEVRGLTTAAGVWATAGIGMACGAGLYLLAIGASGIMIGMQCLQHANVKPFKSKRSFSINIRFQQMGESNRKIKELFHIERFNQLIIERVGDAIWYTAVLQTEEELSSSQLDAMMQEYPFIHSIERCDNP